MPTYHDSDGGSSSGGGHTPGGANRTVRTNAAGNGTTDSLQAQIVENVGASFGGDTPVTAGVYFFRSPSTAGGAHTRVMASTAVNTALYASFELRALNAAQITGYWEAHEHLSPETRMGASAARKLALRYNSNSDPDGGFLIYCENANDLILGTNNVARLTLLASGGARFATGVATAYRQVADVATTVTIADGRIRYSSHTATRIVTLPALSAVPAGFSVAIKGCSTTAAGIKLTIDGNAAETIDGALTFDIATAYGSAVFVAGTTEWGVE